MDPDQFPSASRNPLTSGLLDVPMEDVGPEDLNSASIGQQEEEDNSDRGVRRPGYCRAEQLDTIHTPRRIPRYVILGSAARAGVMVSSSQFEYIKDRLPETADNQQPGNGMTRQKSWNGRPPRPELAAINPPALHDGQLTMNTNCNCTPFPTPNIELPRDGSQRAMHLPQTQGSEASLQQTPLDDGQGPFPTPAPQPSAADQVFNLQESILRRLGRAHATQSVIDSIGMPAGAATAQGVSPGIQQTLSPTNGLPGQAICETSHEVTKCIDSYRDQYCMERGADATSRISHRPKGVVLGWTAPQAPRVPRIRQSRRNVPKNADSLEVYCYCGLPDVGNKMVACADPLCTGKWFHWKCMDAEEKVASKDESWICKTCRKREEEEANPKPAYVPMDVRAHVINTLSIPGITEWKVHPYGL